MLQKIEIEDVSDCESCTARHKGILEFLATTKAKVLTDVICSECGRETHIFVADESERG
jgi:ssDNA-binding Zn-finger/Zn-ribbon topoisomerase 1